MEAIKQNKNNNTAIMTLLHKTIASFFFKLSMVYSIAFAYLGQSRSLAYNGVVASIHS